MPDLSVGIHPTNLMGPDEWPHAGSVDGGAKREGMPPGWEMHANAKHGETVGFLDFMAPMSPSSEADSIELAGGLGEPFLSTVREISTFLQNHDDGRRSGEFEACQTGGVPAPAASSASGLVSEPNAMFDFNWSTAKSSVANAENSEAGQSEAAISDVVPKPEVRVPEPDIIVMDVPLGIRFRSRDELRFETEVGPIAFEVPADASAGSRLQVTMPRPPGMQPSARELCFSAVRVNGSLRNTSGRMPVRRRGEPPPAVPASKKHRRGVGSKAKLFCCRAPGCEKTYRSPDRVRKHCRKMHAKWLQSLGDKAGPADYCTWDAGA